MTRLGTVSLTKDDVNGVGGAMFGTEQELGIPFVLMFLLILIIALKVDLPLFFCGLCVLRLFYESFVP